MNNHLDNAIPASLNEYTKICLEALKDSQLGQFITIGGAVGLAFYHDFRTTKDVDAWWTSEATEKSKQSVISLLEKTLARFGEVKIRRFGDVVSLDLHQSGKITFNIQIANRSALLRPPLKSPWPPVTLDSIEDLVASKMTALIERGAPRDFLDIYEICRQNIMTISRCWELWCEREQKRGIYNVDPETGREAVLLHLSRIERIRPFEKIIDISERNQAQTVRNWFKHDFCKQGK